MTSDDEFSEDDMREFGDFRYAQGYADRSKECACECHMMVCLRGLPGCDARWICIDRRRN